MEKYEYSYGEILFALREEYRKNEELLKRLKQYVLISDSQVADYNFKKQYNSVYLKIQMRQGLIEKFLNKIGKLIGFAPEDIETFTYHLTTYNPMELIDVDRVGFIPKYTINKSEEARKVAREIEKPSIDSYSGIYFGRLSYYKRDNTPVVGERMYIKNEGFEILLPSPKSPFKTISYYPQDVVVTKRSTQEEPGKEYCTVLLREVLATKMPGETIPEKIREIINRNLIKNLSIDVERKIVRDDELTFAIERDRQRVLLRPKNPN